MPDPGKSLSPRGLEMLPDTKVARFADRASVAERPRLQDMVKAALQQSLARVDLTREAHRQTDNIDGKTAQSAASGAPCATCGKAGCTEHKRHDKEAAYALKLASAIEFIAIELSKEGARLGGPALSGHEPGPGKGPGSLHVTQAESSPSLPEHHGQAHHQVPMHPGTQKGLPTEHGATELENTLAHAPGGSARMLTRNQGTKSASLGSRIRKVAEGRADKLEEEESEGMHEAKRGLERAEHAHANEKPKRPHRSSTTSSRERNRPKTPSTQLISRPVPPRRPTSVRPAKAAGRRSAGSRKAPRVSWDRTKRRRATRRERRMPIASVTSPNTFLNPR